MLPNVHSQEKYRIRYVSIDPNARFLYSFSDFSMFSIFTLVNIFIFQCISRIYNLTHVGIRQKYLLKEKVHLIIKKHYVYSPSGYKVFDFILFKGTLDFFQKRAHFSQLELSSCVLSF